MTGLARRTLGFALVAAQAAQPPTQGFRESVSVELVRVDLLATDSKGPIQNLRADEIQVKVDGKPVALESLEAPGAAAPSELPQLPVSSARLPSVQAVPAPSTPAPAPRAKYYMAFLADETSSEQSNRVATYKEVFHFLEEPMPPDVEVLLMRFDGTTHVECVWTSDGERLRRCVAAIAAHKYVSRLDQPGLPRDPGQGTTNTQLDAMEAVGHQRTALAGYFDALRVFPDRPGRKALFVISDGAPFLAPSELTRDILVTSESQNTSALPTPRQQAEAQADRDLLLDSLAWDRTRGGSLLTEIARLALVRGIEIHPVRSMAHDTSAAVRTDRSFSGRARARGGTSNDPSSIRGGQSIAEIQVGGSMTAVAETTGGEAVLSRRSLEDNLKQEVSTRDAGYALTFRDPYPGDHRFHRIEIASTRPGLTLRYRRGYRVLDTREHLVQTAINRLHVPDDRNPLGVRFELQSLGTEKGRAAAQITIAYPAPPEAGGAVSTASVQVLGVCAVKDGPLSQPLDLSGAAERVPFGDKVWLVRTARVSVAPGAYRWSFAVRDEQTGITSNLTFERRLP